MRHGDVEVQMPGLGIVDAEAVQENERLLEGGAPNREVGLNTVGRARLEVERGVLPEVVGDVVEEERLLARVEGHDGAVGLGERYRRNGGCDGDGLVDLRGGEVAEPTAMEAGQVRERAIAERRTHDYDLEAVPFVRR